MEHRQLYLYLLSPSRPAPPPPPESSVVQLGRYRTLEFGLFSVSVSVCFSSAAQRDAHCALVHSYNAPRRRVHSVQARKCASSCGLFSPLVFGHFLDLIKLLFINSSIIKNQSPTYFKQLILDRPLQERKGSRFLSQSHRNFSSTSTNCPHPHNSWEHNNNNKIKNSLV